MVALKNITLIDVMSILDQASSNDFDCESYRVTRLRPLDLKFKNRNVHSFLEMMKKRPQAGAFEAFNYRRGYQDRGIALNVSLAGNWENRGSSTLQYFISNYSERPVGEIRNGLRKFFLLMGFQDNDRLSEYLEEYHKLYLKYFGSNKDLTRPSGRLLQFFVDPKIVDSIAYMAEVRGRPIYFGSNPGTKKTYRPSEFLSALKKDPIEFERRLARQRFNVFEEKSGQSSKVATTALEARMYLDPNILANSNQVRIESYYNHDINEKEYILELTALLRKHVEEFKKEDLTKELFEKMLDSQRMEIASDLLKEYFKIAVEKRRERNGICSGQSKTSK